MNTFWQALDLDLIRFSAKRPTPPQVIAAAKLPPAISALVTKLVRRTRLRQAERSDLAAELCAHFADGLAAGISESQLIRDFGDPAAASRMIARAIKRKRSWRYHLFRRSLQAVGCLILALIFTYAWLFLRFHLRQPNIARNYTAEFNARVTALPVDQRGWTIYSQILPKWVHASKELRDVFPPSDPASEGWKQGIELLKANAANIDLIRKGADLPGWGAQLRNTTDPVIKAFTIKSNPAQNAVDDPPAMENPPLVYTVLPELGVTRHFARVLAFDMDVAAQSHDTARFNADVRALLGICRQMREQRLLISDLVSCAIAALTYSHLGNDLTNFSEAWTDDKDLVQLAHILAAYPGPGDTFRVRFDGERDSFDDMLQRVYSDDGHGDGSVVAKGMELYEGLTFSPGAAGAAVKATQTARTILGPAASAITAGRAESKRIYNDYINRAEAVSATPLWQRGETGPLDADFEHMIGSTYGQARYHVIGLLMPALGAASGQGEYLEQQRDAAMVAVCLEIHKRRHGSYPKSLDQLVPSLLPSIPPDRYTGGPIHYLLKDNKPVVYSVGVDRTDNQGVPPPGPLGNMLAQRYRSPVYIKTILANLSANYASSPAPDDVRGDWVLYPEPKPEPIPAPR